MKEQGAGAEWSAFECRARQRAVLLSSLEDFDSPQLHGGVLKNEGASIISFVFLK